MPPDSKLVIEEKRVALERSADAIMAILRDYIPHALQDRAHWALRAVFEKGGFELTTAEQRETYERVRNAAIVAGELSLKAAQADKKIVQRMAERLIGETKP